MPVWIDAPLAIAVHDRMIAEHGGGTGVRDEKLLESALARPRQRRAYDKVRSSDFADLAASLAFGLAHNMPFLDGNKRTAHVCYRVFLALNDVELDASDEEKYIAMMSLAEGTLKEKPFATWLRQHIRMKPGKRVQEPRTKRHRVRKKPMPSSGAKTKAGLRPSPE